MGTVIKHPVPDRVKPLFAIFDIRALWRSGLIVRVPGCQKLQITAEDRVSRTLTSCVGLLYTLRVLHSHNILLYVRPLTLVAPCTCVVGRVLSSCALSCVVASTRATVTQTFHLLRQLFAEANDKFHRPVYKNRRPTPCLKKTSKIIFVIATSNFHQIWQFLAQRWQTV